MTHPNPPEAVTQADREAAFAYFNLCHREQYGNYADSSPFLSGALDDKHLIQAFGRHRLRHTPDREAIATSVLNAIIRYRLCPQDGLKHIASVTADAIIAMIEGGGA